MNVKLHKLSIKDDVDIYDMLQEIPKLENGFRNSCNGKSYEDFKKWLVKCDRISKGIDLVEGMVPQTVYWLYIDDKPVGMGKLRHKLSDTLMEKGGHGGYAIRPSCRFKGYGKLLLKLLLKEAIKLGISSVYLTIQNENIPSIKVALANGGIIHEKTDIMHRIWIQCDQSLALKNINLKG